MSNLQQFRQNDIVELIYGEYEKHHAKNNQTRYYLGGSMIGHESDKLLWCMFRGVFQESFPGRIIRLFDTGHLEEPRFIADLENIGVQVSAFDHEDGEQWGVEALGGHFKGHLDGIAQAGVPGAEKTPHLLEFKTHNDKSFTDLVSKGVKLSKPQHYAQMQVYMGLQRLTRALYLAKNKNNEELYSERVEYNSTEFKQYMNRAERIINAGEMPQDGIDKPDDWRLRFMPSAYVDFIFGKTPFYCPLPQVDVRSCVHAIPLTSKTDKDGMWRCEATGEVLKPWERCKVHHIHPHLVVGYDAEYDGTNMRFMDSKGRVVFVNGPDGLTSEEVIKLRKDGETEEKKQIFGCKTSQLEAFLATHAPKATPEMFSHEKVVNGDHLYFYKNGIVVRIMGEEAEAWQL